MGQLISDVDQIPTGASGAKAVFTQYNTPFLGAGVPGVASDFPDLLGSTSGADAGSQIDVTVQSLQVIEAALKFITDDIETFASGITSFGSAISPLQDTLTGITDTLE